MGDTKHGHVRTISSWGLTRSPIYLKTSPGRPIGGWTLLAFAACGLVHIAINADPIVALLAGISMMIGMSLIIRFGAFNIGSVLVFLVAFRYVGFPMFAKLILGQVLDSNLAQPVAAFAAVTLGVLSYFFAFMIVNDIKVGLPLLRPVTEPHLLRRLSFIAFLVGIVANLENALRVNLQTDVWNISNSFMSFLHLALISAAASSILKSKGHRILDGWTLTVLAVEVVFAFVQNARTPILEAVLALAVTDIAFRRRFTLKPIVITIVALLLLILITPVFLYVRGVRGDLNWRERITSTVTVFGNWREAEYAFLALRDAEALSSGFFLRYYGTPTNVFERLSLVNHTDVLINGADSVGHLGFEVIDRAIQHALPRLLVPDKPIGYSEGDWMHYEYMGDYRYGNFLTSPLIGVGYASFGWAGVFVFPIILGAAIFLLIKKTVGLNIIGNIWVVYTLISINNQFVEGGTWSYAAMILRKLPQDTIIMLLLSILIGTNRLVFRKAAQAIESQMS